MRHRAVRSIRVIERQYYRLKDCMFYVDPVTGDEDLFLMNGAKRKEKVC